MVRGYDVFCAFVTAGRFSGGKANDSHYLQETGCATSGRCAGRKPLICDCAMAQRVCYQTVTSYNDSQRELLFNLRWTVYVPCANSVHRRRKALTVSLSKRRMMRTIENHDEVLSETFWLAVSRRHITACRS